MNGGTPGCICGICGMELDLTDIGVGGKTGGINVVGLAGKFSVLKIRGKVILLKPRSTKPCSQERVSIKVNRDA
jgi:hypothetical protein